MSTGQEKSTPEHLLYNLAACLSLQLSLGTMCATTCKPLELAAVLMYLGNAKPDSNG